MISRTGLCALLTIRAIFAQPFDPIQQQLPEGAKIIEKMDITKTVGKPRMMVLWMTNPTRKVRGSNGYCGDAVYGDYWEGPTRVTLLNTSKVEVLNTIEIRDYDYEGTGAPDSFRLPFLVSDTYYHVAHFGRNHEGTPELLYLLDLTGDGRRLEFALFAYGVCGVVETRVLGYSMATDRVLQYQIESFSNQEKVRTNIWIDQVFARKPTRPGYWKFTWQPGHGWDGSIDEEVSFDAAREVFVQRQKITEPIKVPIRPH